MRAISSTGLDLIGITQPADKLREFHEVVSWYGSNRPDFRAAVLAVQPKCVFLEALPDKNWRAPASDFFLRQVGGKLGVIPKINVVAEDQRSSVVIHPFSGSSRKNWPLDRYRALAGQLKLHVDWICGPEEHLDGARRFKSLLDLAQWMRGATCYVGNDSGISHLAAATGVPSLAIFGPTDPDVWAPRGEHVSVVRHDPLTELSVEKVLHFFRGLKSPLMMRSDIVPNG